MVLTVTQVTFQ